jgi:hypothetical protein
MWLVWFFDSNCLSLLLTFDGFVHELSGPVSFGMAVSVSYEPEHHHHHHHQVAKGCSGRKEGCVCVLLAGCTSTLEWCVVSRVVLRV